MKKIIFTILLLIFTLASYAQKDSLYVDGMIWVTGYFDFGQDTIDEVYPISHKYIIDGDSVIKGVKYKKLLEFYTCNWVEDDYYVTDLYEDTYFCRYENGKYLFYLPEYKEYWHVEERYIGDDYVFCDESLTTGDIFVDKYNKIGSINDTIFDASAYRIRKCWKLQPHSSISSRYREALNYVAWVEGIGSLSQPIPYEIGEVDCACYQMLLYCINPAGDTIYRNQKYIDLVEPYFKTNIPALKSSAVSFSQRGGECVVTLPYDASAWSATLYNSVGATVARRSGEGSEIVLPATSKGTHILVVNADGRVVKKKVFIK